MSVIKQVVVPNNLSDSYFDKGVNTTNKIEYKLQYTIASLKATSGTNIPSLVYITDTGREGWFKYDSTDSSTANDDSMTIVSGSKRYKRIINNNLINPKWFGAKGDGITDDSQSFNIAKNYLKSIGGGTFFIPKGIFLLSQQVTFDFSNLHIKGEGIGISILKVNAWICAIRVADGYPVATSVLTNITVSDLTVDGNKDGYVNGANDTNGNGVNINACDKVTVEKVEVKNAGEQGIVVTYWKDMPSYTGIKHKSTVIDKCIVWGCKVNRIGIGLEGQIRNARITNNSVYDGGYIHCSSGTLTNYDDEGRLILTNNIVEEGSIIQGIGLWVSDYQKNIIVTNNIIKGFDIGIRVSTTGLGSVKDNLISNNNITDFRQYGVLGFPTLNNEDDNISIFNNVIHTVNNGAIGIYGYKNSIITNNNITGTYLHGVRVHTNCFVTNNKIDIIGSIIDFVGTGNKVNNNFISSAINIVANNDIYFNNIAGYNGFIDIESNKLRFNEAGVRSYTVHSIGGNLEILSGDGLGSLKYNGNSFLLVTGGSLSGGLNIAGNTGFGTTNPLAKADIRGTIHVSDGTGTKTRIRTGGIIDFTDFAENVYVNATFGASQYSFTGGNVGINKTSPNSKLAVEGLPTFADNTAALAGSLTAGDFYRTSTGQLMVVF